MINEPNIPNNNDPSIPLAPRFSHEYLQRFFIQTNHVFPTMILVYLWLNEFGTPIYHPFVMIWLSLLFDPIGTVVLKNLLDLCVVHLIECIDLLLIYSNKVWFIVGMYLSHISSSCSQPC